MESVRMGSLPEISQESINKILLENGKRKSSGPLFRKRNVSTTRAFPAGYGPSVPCTHVVKSKLQRDNNPINDSDCSEDSEVITSVFRKSAKITLNLGPNKLLDDLRGKCAKKQGALEKKTLSKTAEYNISSQRSTGTTDILKMSSLEKRCPKRKVSADRIFPPFCGRNALRPTKEEKQKIRSGSIQEGSVLALLEMHIPY